MGDKENNMQLDGETRNLESDNVRALAEAFPEMVADGTVDFDKLRLILGEDIDDSDERYSFTWPGKRDAIKMAISRTTGTLRPDKKNSKDWDTTENLFIEGDNLEVLRVLQNSYRGKVKMIYIDPPYNTGKDFVYKDDFKDNLRNYKENASLEGQSNPETAGRYHTNWLNMMYPRLRLAKNLLKDDGVIFISIDDHEVTNLRKICSEIFGEDNVEQYVWNLSDFEESSFTKTASNTVRNEHEYIIACFRKVKTLSRYTEFRFINRDDFSNPDNDPRGDWMSGNISRNGITSTTGSKYFTITTRTGQTYTRNWTLGKDEYEDLLKDNRIFFSKDGDGVPRLKIFKNESSQSIQSSIFTGLKTSITGKNEVLELFGNQLFDFPKPTNLIQRLIEISTDNDDIVVDFFAGSGTSGQALLKQNILDGKNRRFILVQIPEATPEDSEARKAGYKTIAEISRKRIKLAGEKIKSDHKDKLAERTTPLDVGFKAFTLDTTNFREWDSNTDNIQNELLAALETFKEGRTSEDALYEVLLKYGVDITEPVEVLNLGGKQVYSLAGNYLLVCLEKNIPLGTIEAMTALKPERVVCYDDGFADEDVKQNALETLKRAGVADVRVV